MTTRLLNSFSAMVMALVSFAQCPTGPLGTGNFLDKPAGCATDGLDIMFTPQYSQLEDNSSIFIDWGDGTTVQEIVLGTTGGQTGITYNIPVAHTYTEANTFGGCVYTITSWVEGPNGCYTIEETTEEAEIVIWNTDNFGDGGVGITPSPVNYTVCAGTTATIQYSDLSPWNCTDLGVTTSVNNQQRWTKWIYGLTNSITGDVTVDGVTVAGSLQGAINTHTTAPVLDPQAPGSTSLEVFIPNTAQVNEQFSIRLANWNQCNPYPASDSVWADAIITVVAPPVPSFVAKDGGPGGPTLTEFCINEAVYFDNQTAGTFAYSWEFYDGPTDVSTLLNTDTQTNPSFTWTVGGDKLVRLTASDGGVDALCDIIYEEVITLTPDAVATFEFYDAGFTSTIDPDFCQTGSDLFTVGFRDNTVDVANTQYRYEFYNESDALVGTHPVDGSYLPDPVPDFTRDFSVEEFIRVRLVAQSIVGNFCSSWDQDTVFVYGKPEPTFNANEACQDARTTFSSITDQFTGFTTRVNDDEIEEYEWDFSYDGSTFNTELLRTDDSNFDWYLDGTDIPLGVEPSTSVAGEYTVALKLKSLKADCFSDIFTAQVIVNPPPTSSFTDSFVSQICPGESIDFTNTSDNTGLTVTYDLEISHPWSGDSFDLTDIGAGTTFAFPNDDDTVRTYDVVLEAITVDGCEFNSNTSTIKVNSDENSGFDDPTFSFIDPNCSPYTSTLFVDANTQSLNVEQYNWTIIDNQDNAIAGFPVTKVSTDPDFNELDYTVSNETGNIQNYAIILEAIKTGVCIANDTFNIQVKPQPEATFTAVRTDNCDDVTFVVEADQKGLTYDWTFTPAPVTQTGNADIQIITYDREVSSGSDIPVQISLQVTNLANCSSGLSIQNFTVEKKDPDLLADFTLSSSTLQLPDGTLTLTNQSTIGVNYEWDLGNGNTSNEITTVNESYTVAGIYQITLTVTDAFCEAIITKPVTVLPEIPIIDFEADTVQGCSPFTVNFTNLSSFTDPNLYLWKFGDGEVSQEENPSHTYVGEGTYTVSLKGENSNDVEVENEKVAYIIVSGKTANFSVDQQDSCEDVVFNLTADEPGLQQYDWVFNPDPDVQTGTDDRQVLTYNRESVNGSDIDVDISLVVTDLDNCVSDLVIDNLLVEKRTSDLFVDLSISDDTLKLPDNRIDISNLGTPDVNYLWEFGDGQTSIGRGPFSYTYNDPGNYTLSLTATEGLCEVNETQLFVLQPEDPIIDFEANDLQGCVPFTVNFTNLSQFADEDEYFWDFGDGNFSEAVDPAYTYFTEGIYTVRLEGKNGLGVQGQNEKVAYIMVSNTPEALFDLEKEDYCEEVTINLRAEEKGLTYQWTFDPEPDSVVDDGDTQTLTYIREDNLGMDIGVEVSLQVTNDGNCESALEIQTSDVEKRNPELVADFVLSRDTLKLPDSEIFITNFSTQNVNYTWDFGDGNLSNETGAFSYAYNQFGNYQIFLTVTDDYCQATAVKPFVLLPADPVIDFTADIVEGCTPLTVRFTNLSTGAEPGKYIWEFGDGTVSRGDEPIHTYSIGGEFTVRLRGENVAGISQEEEKENFVTSYSTPRADFVASPKIVYIPDQKVFFRNLTPKDEFTQLTYFWDFGDGQTSTEEEPQHAYENEGFYDITMVVTNELGCSDSLFRRTEVEAITGGTVNSPNAFTPSLLGSSGGEIGGTPGGGDVSTINDVFLPILDGVEKFRMQIFNKWGQMVFESNSQTKGWDGYYKGKLAPAGVYIYKLKLNYSDGTSAVKVGDLTLVR